jgi:hypothetical protein
MRWNGLFADLEAQAGALDTAQRSAEVDERARGEVAQLLLSDRLRAAAGSVLRVEVAGDVAWRGSLTRVGADWFLLAEENGGEVLVALSAVSGLTGVGRLSAAPATAGLVGARLGLRAALRAMARDRSALRIHRRHGAPIDGTIDRVGADYAELAGHAPGELRRRAEVREVVLVPLNSIAAVRRAA